MRALGIEVTASTASGCGVRRSLVRLVGMVLAAMPLFAGYVPILLRDDRRGLHDLLAGSDVRYAEKKRRPPPRPKVAQGIRQNSRPSTANPAGPTLRCPARS